MKTATPEQLAALTVPARLPGVVRRCTPLISTKYITYDDCPQRGIALAAGIHGHQGVVLLDWDRSSYKGGAFGKRARNLAVDLTDATGRAHLCWAVANRLGLTQFSSPLEISDPTEWQDDHPREWLISIGPHCDVFEVSHPVWEALPDGIDPDDDTRLPDGSRLVDALALRAVALHVLGGA